MPRIYISPITKRKGLSIGFSIGILIAIWIIFYFLKIEIFNFGAKSTMDIVISIIIIFLIYTIAFCFFYFVIFRGVEN